MKTLTISLVALAALAGIAQASDRSYDLRESDTFFGKFSEQSKGDLMPSAQESQPLAVIGDASSLTAFERMKALSDANEHGRK